MYTRKGLKRYSAFLPFHINKYIAMIIIYLYSSNFHIRRVWWIFPGSQRMEYILNILPLLFVCLPILVMLCIFSQISNSCNLFARLFGTAPSAPRIIGTAVTLLFRTSFFFTFLAK